MHVWAATLQNWQSEFLAVGSTVGSMVMVGSMVIFSVYLRQRAVQADRRAAPRDGRGGLTPTRR